MPLIKQGPYTPPKEPGFNFSDLLNPGFLIVFGTIAVIALIILLNVLEPKNKAYYERKIDHIERLHSSAQARMLESFNKGNVDGAHAWQITAQKHQNKINDLRNMQNSAPE